jgi:hypothetical protein
MRNWKHAGDSRRRDSRQHARSRRAVSVLVAAAVTAAAHGCGCANKGAEEARRKHIEKLKSYVAPDVLRTVPDEFYSHPGFRDWYRFPLVYPYSVHTIDDLERGYVYRHSTGQRIANGEEERLQITNLTHLAFDGRLLVARVDPNPRPPFRGAGDTLEPVYWIVLKFETGALEEFASQSDAVTNAEEQGFTGDETLESLEVHYNRCFR